MTDVIKFEVGGDYPTQFGVLKILRRNKNFIFYEIEGRRFRAKPKIEYVPRYDADRVPRHYSETFETIQTRYGKVRA